MQKYRWCATGSAFRISWTSVVWDSPTWSRRSNMGRTQQQRWERSRRFFWRRCSSSSRKSCSLPASSMLLISTKTAALALRMKTAVETRACCWIEEPKNRIESNNRIEQSKKRIKKNRKTKIQNNIPWSQYLRTKKSKIEKTNRKKKIKSKNQNPKLSSVEPVLNATNFSERELCTCEYFFSKHSA